MATEENKGKGEDKTDQEDTRKDSNVLVPWLGQGHAQV